MAKNDRNPNNNQNDLFKSLNKKYSLGLLLEKNTVWKTIKAEDIWICTLKIQGQLQVNNLRSQNTTRE